MFLLETGLVVLAFLVAVLYPQLGSPWFETAENVFSRVARQRGRAVLMVGFLALGLRAAMLPVEPIPEPVVHDEFGYLLAADTFAHGRLTNPTPPMWEHFETFSILMKPTYQCFAQPGQGMMLALGKVVFGHPFWGMWLSCGLMCAATTWMLQGWLAPEWALLGGLLAVFRYGIFGYWADSYWGGAVGAIGGALVLGALPRIKESQHFRDALLLGLGLIILANSRPYEGLLLALPVAVVLFALPFCGNRSMFTRFLRRTIAPLTVVLIAGGLWMGYYFWRVTGNPLRMPYQQERVVYGNVPQLLWQPQMPEKNHDYHSAAMRQLYTDGEIKLYHVMHTSVGFIYVEIRKLISFWRFYLGPVLTAPLLLLLVSLPYGFSWHHIRKPIRFLLAAMGFCTLGMAAEIYFEPHYAAPLTGVTLILVLKAMRVTRVWQARGGHSGLFFARAIPVICLIMLGCRAGVAALHVSLPVVNAPGLSQQSPPPFGRARIESQLKSLEGRHLVIVQYGNRHNPFEEWVYNDADLPHAKVVWARELPGVDNEALIHAFSGREVWLLEADAQPPRLMPHAFNHQVVKETVH